jgi:glucan phosphorylase
VVPCTSLEGLKHCKNGTFSSTVASMSRLRRRRDRFEALARSVRDVLSQRRLLAEKTYEEKNPKRLYYLSMEFLLGRSFANNVVNLMLSHRPVHPGQETESDRDSGAETETNVYSLG